MSGEEQQARQAIAHELERYVDELEVIRGRHPDDRDLHGLTEQLKRLVIDLEADPG